MAGKGNRPIRKRIFCPSTRSDPVSTGVEYGSGARRAAGQAPILLSPRNAVRAGRGGEVSPTPTTHAGKPGGLVLDVDADPNPTRGRSALVIPTKCSTNPDSARPAYMRLEQDGVGIAVYC